MRRRQKKRRNETKGENNKNKCTMSTFALTLTVFGRLCPLCAVHDRNGSVMSIFKNKYRLAKCKSLFVPFFFVVVYCFFFLIRDKQKARFLFSFLYLLLFFSQPDASTFVLVLIKRNEINRQQEKIAWFYDSLWCYRHAHLRGTRQGSLMMHMHSTRNIRKHSKITFNWTQDKISSSSHSIYPLGRSSKLPNAVKLKSIRCYTVR